MISADDLKNALSADISDEELEGVAGGWWLGMGLFSSFLAERIVLLTV